MQLYLYGTFLNKISKKRMNANKQEIKKEKKSVIKSFLIKECFQKGFDKVHLTLTVKVRSPFVTRMKQ